MMRVFRGFIGRERWLLYSLFWGSSLIVFPVLPVAIADKTVVC